MEKDFPRPSQSWLGKEDAERGLQRGCGLAEAWKTAGAS